MSTKIKPATSFWVISVLGLLWNLFGVFAYLGQSLLTNETAKGLVPQNQLDFIQNTPKWVSIAFAIAVFGGFLGCLLLLFRKKLAKLFLVISFIGVLVQLSYNFFMSNGYDVYGNAGAIQAGITVFICLFLIAFSNRATNAGILN